MSFNSADSNTSGFAARVSYRYRSLLLTAFAIPVLAWVLFLASLLFTKTGDQGAGFVIGMAMMIFAYPGGLLSILLSLIVIVLSVLHALQESWADHLHWILGAAAVMTFSIVNFFAVGSFVFAGLAG